ncbi:DUF4144 family protein [Shewanella donghaensis]|uniref:DUF4144 family protein n=1 Tax=Shewanella donghaensis TaxID=238836 RepID=UPI0011829B56|nr:DUF4144 family protein [Shewanella donghaensis]
MQEIQWPAIIKQQDCEELIYLASDRDWLEYCCLTPHILDSTDQLLDTKGNTYDIAFENDSQLEFRNQATTQLPQLSLSIKPIDVLVFIKYVRLHAQLNGHCCSSKLAFSTIKQGIETVEFLDSEFS